ncbi:hypothetical protein H6P81_016292 [Aristolochia fimbriata]|uniref:Uncharacterized protein n=1 Tax=Aristolochia fimbriata TaxID=158543 RepID=A0AAV7E7X9_ARIFI|nr:hypothetical protein H6P81_016292 [Aristolochia fimbriata]
MAGLSSIWILRNHSLPSSGNGVAADNVSRSKSKKSYENWHIGVYTNINLSLHIFEAYKYALGSSMQVFCF